MIRDEKTSPEARNPGSQPERARKKKEMPGGLWMRCKSCEKTVFKPDVERLLNVCPECNHHFLLNSAQRVQLILDAASFEEFDADLAPRDFLNFTDLKPYPERLKAAEEKTGMKDAATVGVGTLHGRTVVMGVLDFTFIGGSMGYVVGEKLSRAMDRAAELKVPLLIFTGSGGARMMEGVVSLMQMAKTCAALARFQKEGGVFISCLTDPSTGGVLASFASLGDVILAEPGAVIGFAGPRVIQNTIRQELPDGFQRSEFMLRHGFIDRIVHRSTLRDDIAKILDLLLGPMPGHHPPAAPKEERGEGKGSKKGPGTGRGKANGSKGSSAKGASKNSPGEKSSKKSGKPKSAPSVVRESPLEGQAKDGAGRVAEKDAGKTRSAGSSNPKQKVSQTPTSK